MPTAAPNFDGLAPFYESLERTVFGRLLEKTRRTHLEPSSEVREALLLGEGDGRTLLFALMAWPRCRFLVVDGSTAMLAEARNRVARHLPNELDRVEFRHLQLPEEVDHLAKEEIRFDRIVTPFFLDCFTEKELTTWVPEIADLLHPKNGTWILADFALPERNPSRWAGKIFIRFLYRCFRLSTGLQPTALPDHAPIFKNANLSLLDVVPRAGGLLRGERWTRKV